MDLKGKMGEDNDTILTMPNEVQIQMSEGVEVIDEAIDFLSGLQPLPSLEWEPLLAKSALFHVEDIGPKGYLQYQSSDDTQPQERIERFGSYVNSLGENIDFGPNDAIGVIISLTIDDGEEGRPHRENLFSQEYKKVGIACGFHKSEYDMCVMDFAYDFFPLDNKKKQMGKVLPDDLNSNKDNKNVSMFNEPVVNLNLCETLEGTNNRTQIYNNNYDFNYNNRMPNNNMMNNNMNNNPMINNNMNNNVNMNQSPVVKLSLDNDNFKNNLKDLNDNFNAPQKQSNFNQNANANIRNGANDNDQFETMRNNVFSAIAGRKVVKKEVTITTKIVSIYDDGSTKTEEEVKKHTFNC